MKAIYVRTSTDDNDGAAQLHELRQWCEREGWGKVREYVDRGESGTKDSRPAWDKLREAVATGNVDALVVTELSRIGRSVLGVVLALDAFYRRGCRVVLLRQGLDYATPVGRMVATMLAAVAQLERDQIAERVQAGVRRARAEGTRSGRPIGRPRAIVSDKQLAGARQALDAGDSWRVVAGRLGIPVTTLRRGLQAYQKAEREAAKTAS